MKTFNLFHAASGSLGTYNLTADPKYRFVEAISQVCNHILDSELFHQPFLHLFTMVHQDDTNFPDDLKDATPAGTGRVEDCVSNQIKTRQIRDHLPTDGDVVDFFTHSFPDLYMVPHVLLSDGMDWGQTLSGQGQSWAGW